MSAMGMTQTIRLFFKYNTQHFMATGDKNNWYVVNKGLLNGILIEVCVFFAVTLLVSGIVLTRMLPSSVNLTAPMTDLKCTSLTTVQFSVKFCTGIIIAQVQKKISGLIKDVKKSFPLRELYQKISKKLVLGLFFNEFPYWLKQFWTEASNSSSDQHTYKILTWICVLIWGNIYIHGTIIDVLV